MAKYKKKRARELQHDKFRDAAGRIFDKVADKLEGKGKHILYVLGGLVVLAILVGVYLKWSYRKTDEALQALGRGITITSGAVAKPSPEPGDPPAAYASEQERAQRAIDVFQQVAAKYGDPYKTQARYFIGTNLLIVDREKGLTELEAVSKTNVPEVATLAKLALAQAKEAGQNYDEAARLYSELAAQNSIIVTPDNANLGLASVYEKQGKKSEAAEILFKIVEAARKAKDTDGLPLSESAAAREAGTRLQKLDPDRYAKLTPAAPPDSPF
ncbi:MAG TPA: hypothetical protein VLL54_04040 [Pyrinomonadaceae bacterium]|nr:hypothetical protein [Pyrinomonadaceae bacterium]